MNLGCIIFVVFMSDGDINRELIKSRSFKCVVLLRLCVVDECRFEIDVRLCAPTQQHRSYDGSRNNDYNQQSSALISDSAL